MKFNWFGEQEHRVFNYRPIYYDEQKEDLKRKFGKVDGSLDKDKEKGTYVPGSYINGSFRDGNYSKRRGTGRAQNIIGLIGIVLLGAMLIYLAKFYALF